MCELSPAYTGQRGKSVKLLGDERVSAYRNINLIMMSYTNAGSTFRRSLFINWGDGGKVF